MVAVPPRVLSDSLGSACQRSAVGMFIDEDPVGDETPRKAVIKLLGLVWGRFQAFDYAHGNREARASLGAT